MPTRLVCSMHWSFAKSSAKKKIVILGDMFELGAEAAKEHQFIAHLAAQLKFDKIVLVGNEFSKTTNSDTVLKFLWLLQKHTIGFNNRILPNAEILLKGSRSMKMEKVVE